MNNKTPLIALFFEFHKSLLSRDFIIDYFVDAELVDKETALRTKMIKPGKLYTENNKTYVVTEATSKTEIRHSREIFLPEDYKLDFYYRFNLQPGMIENHNESPIETTLGVFILNQILLVNPFGATIPYVNGLWNVGKIEKEIARLTIAGKITPAQIYQYVNNAHHIGGLNDFCVPALSERCITSNDEVSKFRDNLLLQYKDQLDDPNITLMIENACIELDRKLMAGDDCTGFLISDKSYDVQRKRMFIMMGLIPSFGDDIAGFNFSQTNLNDGWKMDELPTLSNDTRRGSYDRGTSTALGGAESKILGRNFQDSAITENDCGSKRGVSVYITQDNLSSYTYRTAIIGDKLLLLTPDNIHNYINKTITIRSARYCQTKNGYCYTCMDSRFKEMGIKLLNVQPINIGSVLVTQRMKSMHGTKVSTLEMSDLNNFIY